MEKGFIKNIVIIIIILTAVFFSQQPNSREYGKNLYNQAFAQGQSWWQGAYSYAKQNVFSKIGGEVEKKKEVIQDELQKEKNKISENILQKIKNYFSDIILRVFKPSASSEQVPSNSAPANQWPSQDPLSQ